MPITLQKIATNTAEVQIQWGEDTVHLLYYPGRVTEKIIADFQQIAKLSEDTIVAGFQSFNGALSNLLKDWDVFEDEAETTKFPIDASRFSELPLGFRMAIFNTIMGDIRPEMIARTE